MVRRLIFSKFLEALDWSKTKIKDYLGLSDVLSEATKVSRTGLGLSGALLILASLWLLVVEPDVLAGTVLAAGLIGFGLLKRTASLSRQPTFSVRPLRRHSYFLRGRVEISRCELYY